jgi:hypothetical protein
MHHKRLMTCCHFLSSDLLKHALLNASRTTIRMVVYNRVNLQCSEGKISSSQVQYDGIHVNCYAIIEALIQPLDRNNCLLLEKKYMRSWIARLTTANIL